MPSAYERRNVTQGYGLPTQTLNKERPRPYPGIEYDCIGLLSQHSVLLSRYLQLHDLFIKVFMKIHVQGESKVSKKSLNDCISKTTQWI